MTKSPEPPDTAATSPASSTDEQLPPGWEVVYERADGSQVCPDTQDGKKVWLAFLQRPDNSQQFVGAFPEKQAAMQALDEQHPHGEPPTE